MFWKRFGIVGLSLAICSSLLGCGGNSLDTVPAEGVVTFEGEPVPKITVVFMPEGGRGQIAKGTTDAEGKFSLQTRSPGDGAMVGDYSIAFQYTPDEPPDMPGFPGAKPVVSPLPQKYADTASSGVTATIESDASENVFNFDLN